jgi:hypothetical protein
LSMFIGVRPRSTRLDPARSPRHDSDVGLFKD